MSTFQKTGDDLMLFSYAEFLITFPIRFTFVVISTFQSHVILRMKLPSGINAFGPRALQLNDKLFETK